MPFSADYSLNTSTSSLLCDEQYIQTFTKQLLQKQIFMGRYTSRQYVDQIQGYRDLVVIEHNEDIEEVLREVYEKLTDYYRDDKWIGITMPDFPGTPSAYCFWVQFNPNSVIQKTSNTSVSYSQQRRTFEHGIPFGKYWFSVSSVKYKLNEVIVKLKILRPTENENIFTDTTNRHSLQEENITSTGIDTNIDNIEYTITNIKLFYYSCKNNIYEFVQENVTKENIKEGLSFLTVLLATLFIYSVHCCKYLGDYSIMFIHALANLVRALTPWFTALVEMVTKVFGGVLILISMIFKPQQVPLRPVMNNIQYRQVPAIRYHY